MNNPVLHQVTSQRLKSFIDAPSHAVLLVGPDGSGKLTLAKTLLEAVLKLPAGGLTSYPYLQHIQPLEPGKAIGIEEVRQLEHFLSLKVPRSGDYTRAVIIEAADALTTEAQNALLKTLEEPPAGTIIVLTASYEQSLLPTIRSRSQSIPIKRPKRADVEAYFHTENFDDTAIKRAMAISGGLPGLMSALLSQTEHPLLVAAQQARQLLSQPAYQRLLLVEELSKDRVQASQTAGMLQQMAHIKLQTAKGALAGKWQAILEAAYKADEDLSASVQPKLVLTELMLNL